MGQKHVGKALRSLEKVEFAIDTENIDLKILFSSDPLSTVYWGTLELRNLRI